MAATEKYAERCSAAPRGRVPQLQLRGQNTQSSSRKRMRLAHEQVTDLRSACHHGLVHSGPLFKWPPGVGDVYPSCTDKIFSPALSSPPSRC